MVERPKYLNGVPVPYDAEVSFLVSQLNRPGPQAWAAFLALGYHQSEEAFKVLVEYATSTNWEYRRAAVDAIAKHSLGKSVVQLLIALLKDPSQYVVREACNAISHLRLQEAHDPIMSLLDLEEDYTKSTALEAIRVLWRPADFASVFHIFCTDPSGDVRRTAAWTLRENASQKTWNELFNAWRTDSLGRHRVWATELVGEFGDSMSGKELAPLLEDPDGHVRKAARRALKKLLERDS